MTLRPAFFEPAGQWCAAVFSAESPWDITGGTGKQDGHRDLYGLADAYR